MASQAPFNVILKVASLWMVLLLFPFTERTLLGLQTHYGLFIGLGLAFVMYGLTIHSIFAFLQHTKREPVYIYCVPPVVFFYLLHSGCLRYRI